MRARNVAPRAVAADARATRPRGAVHTRVCTHRRRRPACVHPALHFPRRAKTVRLGGGRGETFAEASRTLRELIYSRLLTFCPMHASFRNRYLSPRLIDRTINDDTFAKISLPLRRVIRIVVGAGRQTRGETRPSVLPHLRVRSADFAPR